MKSPDEVPEFAGIDPHRLIAAAHELGHYLIFTAAGIEVSEIRVIGRGSSAAGYVCVPPGQSLDEKQQRQLLVGGLAGRQADLRFCEQFGLPPQPAYTCASDMKIVRRDRRQMQDSTWISTLRAEARRLVLKHWPHIVRRAPQLARRGTLTV